MRREEEREAMRGRRVGEEIRGDEEQMGGATARMSATARVDDGIKNTYGNPDRKSE